MMSFSEPPRIGALLPRFLVAILGQMHAPYIWNAKGDLLQGRRTFDCSGLVTWAYQEAGGENWRSTHNTDRLWAALPSVSLAELKAGDLLFWGQMREGVPDPEHVGVYLGGGVLVSAGGGGRETTTLERAARDGAMVRAEASIHYRRNFLGARRLPWAGRDPWSAT
jgi:murein DD-endopeptidase